MIRAKGEHTTIEGAKRIVELKHSMNKARSWEERYDSIAARIDNIVVTPEWIRGYSEGEGNWGMYNNAKEGYFSLMTNFTISQNSHDFLILERIKEYFGKGFIKDVDRETSNAQTPITKELAMRLNSKTELRITSAENAVNYIIPFFDEYPLLGNRRLDFMDWKRAVEMAHNRKSGDLIKLAEIHRPIVL